MNQLILFDFIFLIRYGLHTCVHHKLLSIMVMNENRQEKFLLVHMTNCAGNTMSLHFITQCDYWSHEFDNHRHNL